MTLVKFRVVRDVVGSRGEVVCSCCGQGAHRTQAVDPVVITGGTGHRRSGHESPSGIMAAKVPPKKLCARTHTSPSEQASAAQCDWWGEGITRCWETVALGRMVCVDRKRNGTRDVSDTM